MRESRTEQHYHNARTFDASGIWALIAPYMEEDVIMLSEEAVRKLDLCIHTNNQPTLSKKLQTTITIPIKKQIKGVPDEQKPSNGTTTEEPR